MDIFTRLLGGAASARKPENGPQQRLIRFKKVHDQLQLIWRRNNASDTDVTPPEPLLHCLQAVRQILQNEVQTPAPHLCARHVATFHIYSTMAQLAAIYPDDGIIKEALAIFKILLDSEEGDFLKDKAFADALVGFISTVSASVLPMDTEAAAIEVLYHVAAKVRLEPQLLSTWFRPSKRGWALPAENQKASKDKEEFILFYMILDYVHHEGRTGDFARTGILYLIESAAHSAALEQWVIESDLATLMASGLGALYSQLSRKLIIVTDDYPIPPVIAFSQSERPRTPLGVDKSSSLEFKAHLRTFLSYLTFWQDVLEHCHSQDVKQSLLDHFKFLFLQQLLYPSLIESSDRDGGSSVAVLTYLKCIIESVDHPDLVQLIFEYLLAIPERKPEEKPVSRPTALARRRRSQSLVASLAQAQEKPLPDLFNLDDLVLGSLRSSNQQTVTATLRLISTMLRSHHQYDLSLIKMARLNNTLHPRSLDAHEKSTALLFTMIEKLMHDPSLADSYELHLEDAQNLLEAHACSIPLLGLPDDGWLPTPRKFIEASNVTLPTEPTLDPVLRGLVTLLEAFFVNDIETNLSLTQVFATTTSCAKRGLEDWFLTSEARFADAERKTQKDVAIPDSNDGADSIGAIVKNDDLGSGKDSTDQNHDTPMFTALNSLLEQVESFRQTIEDFDIYLTERRHIFKTGEDSECAAMGDSTPSRRSEDTNAGNRPRVKSIPHIGSISERLLSENASSAGSRSQSPRGRQAEAPSTTALAGRLSHLRQSPSRSPAIQPKRGVSPSPLRKEVSSESPVKSPGTPMRPSDALGQKIRISVKRAFEPNISDVKSDTSSVRSESTANDTAKEEYREVSLSHVLTNVIILQEFLLELVAIVQVRASVFGEVRFD